MTLFTMFRVDQTVLSSGIDGKIGVKTRELVTKLVVVLEIKSRAIRWSEYSNEPRRAVWDNQVMHSTLHAAGSCVSVYQVVDECPETSIGLGVRYSRG